MSLDSYPIVPSLPPPLKSSGSLIVADSAGRNELAPQWSPVTTVGGCSGGRHQVFPTQKPLRS